MFKNLIIILALLMAGSSIYAQTADEIVAKMEDAYGTKKAYDNIKSLKLEAKMEITAMGQSFKYKYATKDTDKIYFELDVPDHKTISCINGKGGWMSGEGKVLDLPEEQVAEMKDQIESQAGLFTNMIFKIKRDSNKIEYLGKEKVDDKICYKIGITNKDGDQSNIFVDTKTNYICKVSMIRQEGGTDTEIELVMKDYKKVSGIVFAHTIDIKADGTTQQSIIFNNLELNVPVDDAIFTKPVSKEDPK